VFGKFNLKKFFGLLALMPYVVTACPNWQAIVENSQLLKWDYQLNPHNIEVVSDPQDHKSQIIKLTITPSSTWPNGHTRTEVKHNGCTTSEAENTFFSWEFYLDKPIKTSNNIAYWETDNSYQQSMGFYLAPILNNNKTTTELTFFSSLPKRIAHWQDTVTIGEWNKIAMAITWSESEQSGRISIWFNHQPILTELAVKTKPDTNKLFVQLGLHRNQAEPEIDSIYLRNIKEVADLKTLLAK
jgi:hypothetical protein